MSDCFKLQLFCMGVCLRVAGFELARQCGGVSERCKSHPTCMLGAVQLVAATGSTVTGMLDTQPEPLVVVPRRVRLQVPTVQSMSDLEWSCARSNKLGSVT